MSSLRTSVEYGIEHDWHTKAVSRRRTPWQNSARRWEREDAVSFLVDSGAIGTRVRLQDRGQLKKKRRSPFGKQKTVPQTNDRGNCCAKVR